MIINYGQAVVRKFRETVQTISARWMYPDLNWFNNTQTWFGPASRRVFFYNSRGNFSSGSYTLWITNTPITWSITSDNRRDRIVRVEMSGVRSGVENPTTVTSPNGTLNMSTLPFTATTLVWEANDPDGELNCTFEVTGALSTGTVPCTSITVVRKEKR